MAKEQILIADDDVLLRHEIERNLVSLGYQVCGRASNGSDAVALIPSANPDLVLLDISMPGGMDGIQAAEHIQSLHVPFVYLTGFSDGPVLERAKLSEPCGYIVKPFEPHDLKVGIEIALHRHRAQHQRDAEAQARAAASRLMGKLSICCYCKKVKEPDDVWTQIETYIMQRTDASFSHGMCPACFDRVKKQLEALENDSTQSTSLVLG